MRIASPATLALLALLLMSDGCESAGESASGEVAAATGAETAKQVTVYKPAIDPVKANGQIFVNWPKPQVALLISGELDGYIEPCGCAGLENQLGGLKRRQTFIKDLEKQGWPLVSVDMGGLVKRTGLQTEIKYRYALESLVQMGYSAVALGANDLALDAGALSYPILNLEPQKNPVVSANVGLYDLEQSVESGMTKRYRIVEAGGKRIGVTTVLGAKHQQALKDHSEIGTISPADALARVAPEIAAEKPDLQVLLVNGDREEASALSHRFPQFQIVAAAGGAEEPPLQPKRIPGSNAILVEPGHKGMYVIVLGVTGDAKQPIIYQRVPLDSRFGDASEMQSKLVAYQKELQTMTLAGLGLSGTQHPDGDFAGSAACADCHTKAWAVYEKTPHYHATETLAKRVSPPRQFDPECLSCHVTGWNAQEYLPYLTGYVSEKETPDLVGNGCENCHGPAAAHVKVQSGEVEVSEEEAEAIRASLRMKIVPNEGNQEGQEFGEVVKNCMKCHDIDNSPDFDFQTYWPKVKHEGKD
jgi:hypothetical protein